MGARRAGEGSQKRSSQSGVGIAAARGNNTNPKMDCAALAYGNMGISEPVALQGAEGKKIMKSGTDPLTAGRRQFEEEMEKRRAQEMGLEWKKIRRGWCLGSGSFRVKLLERMEGQAKE